MKDKFSIIEGRILTEKSMKEREAGKYYFNVNPNATKSEIKRFVEEFFKTKVSSRSHLPFSSSMWMIYRIHSIAPYMRPPAKMP